MRNVARLLFAALVLLTVVIVGSPAMAETTHDATPSLAQPSPAPLPPGQHEPLQASWLPLSTRSAQPSDYCFESYFDGTCWFYHDYCSGWCTLECPWGDSQGPC
jgi:hypothetical protein